LRNVNIIAVEIHDGCKPQIEAALRKGNWKEFMVNEIFVFVNLDAMSVERQARDS
jgi:hypothetical protein